MPTPKVSVVMAACNAERHIAAAIESVRAQTLRDWELVVVDDGSADGTGAIVGEYARRDGRVRIIRQDNAGLATARNVGIADSRGEMIALMDSDDLALPQRLELQYAHLDAHPDCAAASCRCELIDARGDTIKMQRACAPMQLPGLPLAQLLRAQILVNQTAMFRRALFADSAPYRPWLRVLEDIDLSLRIAEQHRIDYLNAPLYQYRQYPAQADNLMNRDPVLLWHYWCAIALSAHCRRAEQEDPLADLDADGPPPRAFLPAVAALPSAIKAACIRNARHWCRRLLRQQPSGIDGIARILDDLALVATDSSDRRALRKIRGGVLLYALRAGQWRLLPRIARALR